MISTGWLTCHVAVLIFMAPLRSGSHATFFQNQTERTKGEAKQKKKQREEKEGEMNVDNVNGNLVKNPGNINVVSHFRAKFCSFTLLLFPIYHKNDDLAIK